MNLKQYSNETCKNVLTSDKYFECSECGFVIVKSALQDKCPLCGRKIVKENS